MKRTSWMLAAAATVGSVIALVGEALACGPHLPDSSLRRADWSDPDLGTRSVDDPDPDWRAPKRWSVMGRALRELEPAEHYPRVAGLSTLELEEQQARRWFHGDARRVQAYLAFVADPLETAPPRGTPRAAVLYRTAVGRMHEGELEAAVEGFEAVLELPPAEARPRILWAHYMLGNLRLGDGPAASAHYEQIRALVDTGVPDPLGLAFGSLRRDGLTRQGWDDAGYVRLCHAYVQGGGRQDCGVASRSDDAERVATALAERVLGLDDAELDGLAADPWLATAVTAHQIYAAEHSWRGLDNDARELRWISAIEANRAVLGNDLLGLSSALAYQHGDWAKAARWAALGSPRDPRIADVRARLATRRSDPNGIIEALMDAKPLSRAHGDRLAVALLDTGQYTQAVRTYLHVGNWRDAAWVAERLLTRAEIEALIDDPPEELPVDAPMSVLTWAYYDLHEGWTERAANDVRASLWALLARRLAREGRWDEAVRAFEASAALTFEGHEQHQIAAAARQAAGAWRPLSHPATAPRRPWTSSPRCSPTGSTCWPPRPIPTSPCGADTTTTTGCLRTRTTSAPGASSRGRPPQASASASRPTRTPC
jgi:tetratricopeptide (TPR) repeat protein